MLIRKRRAGEGDIPCSEITPYELYVDRRRFIAQGAAEMAEIAKEKGPSIAAGAVSAAREKLAKVLPFARRAEPVQPHVAAAE